MDRSDNIRIDRADLSAPCLIIWDPKEEKFVVIDGIHRLAKAIRDKIECLPCVKVTQELIDRYRI
jgi:DTW domain-containing protein YfiP